MVERAPWVGPRQGVTSPRAPHPVLLFWTARSSKQQHTNCFSPTLPYPEAAPPHGFSVGALPPTVPPVATQYKHLRCLLQKLHIRTVPLGEQPRRIAHQDTSRTFAVTCTQANINLGGAAGGKAAAGRLPEQILQGWLWDQPGRCAGDWLADLANEVEWTASAMHSRLHSWLHSPAVHRCAHLPHATTFPLALST